MSVELIVVKERPHLDYLLPRVPKDQPLEPGKMYLQLYHGRKEPAQEMEKWGEVGPVIGPLTDVVVTYFSTIRLFWGDPAYPNEGEIRTFDDMVRFQDMYYGDWSIFIAQPEKNPMRGT